MPDCVTAAVPKDLETKNPAGRTGFFQYILFPGSGVEKAPTRRLICAGGHTCRLSDYADPQPARLETQFRTKNQ